ncbi:MAG TPA: signal peptide peptidase SppA [Nitrospiraceae bacterium]|nr:signal peptide peptidase SppA [Nitrospiraceae bacterium]
MKKIVVAIVAPFLMAGCVFMNVSLTDEIRPLEEKVLSGEGKNKIVLVDISGVLSSRDSSRGILGGKKRINVMVKLREELDKARKDGNVKAIVLRINSPGGTVTASDTLYHEIKQFKADTGISVIAHVMDIGTSGAYYAALAADTITAQPTAVTGSIGVVLFRIDATGLLEKVGVQAEQIASGKRKGMGSPFRRLSKDERNLFQGMIDSLHGRFVSTVAEERRMPLAKVRRLSDGRIFTSQEAKTAGLIDGIGYLDDALEQARKLAKVDHATVVAYSRPGEYRPNMYSLSLFTVDMGEIVDPGMNFMYIWWI